MKFNHLLLSVLILLLANSVKGQRVQSGEFLSNNGDYLKIINDHQLISNITPYENVNTYEINNDSLITTKKLRISDGRGSRDTISRKAFRIVVNGSDTFSIRKYQDQGTAYESVETITFIKVNKLLRPVNNFQLIVLKTFSGFDGTRTIQIDSKGNLLYVHVPLAIRPDEEKRSVDKIVAKLTKEEFVILLNKISRAMIVPPSLKECFVLDYSSEMTIDIDGKFYNCNHCTENYLHNELTNYLVDLEHSKGITKNN